MPGRTGWCLIADSCPLAGDILVEIGSALSSDRLPLIDLYLSVHAQTSKLDLAKRTLIERTVDANLLLAAHSPRDLLFLKSTTDGETNGIGLGRRRSGGRYSLEIIVDARCLRRGIGRAMLHELVGRCRNLGAVEACGHIYRHNAASIALFRSAGFTLRGQIKGSDMIEFVKLLG